jgi:hypothetical protein
MAPPSPCGDCTFSSGARRTLSPAPGVPILQVVQYFAGWIDQRLAKPFGDRDEAHADGADPKADC